MDVEYVRDNLNKDPKWVNKLFREACARFLAASPVAEKITVEIERTGTTVYMKINGAEVEPDGTLKVVDGN